MGESMIRRATLDDLGQVISLVREFCTADRHPFDPIRVENALRPLLLDDAFGQVWVIEQLGRLSGYAVVTWGYSLESGGRECILDEIFVLEKESGEGSRLLEFTIDEARSCGARSMFLETEAHNQRVRGFYARHGFEIENSVWLSRSLD